MRKTRNLSIGLTLACMTGAAGAITYVAAPPANAVTYVTGGVTLEERDAMRLEAGQYNTWLWFASRDGGHNLSDVRVTIVDHHAKPVLTAVTDGPWLLTNLPPGSYRVTAVDENHNAMVRSFRVTPKGQVKTIITFPEF